MPHAIRPGDVLAGRYQLIDLLDESAGGLFYRAHDSSLDRSVAVHIIRADDERAALLREAARTSARVVDRRLLRVLDVDETSDQTTRDGSALCFVVNEWATGVSLDILLADDGPLAPRRAAWLIGEVAATLEVAHAAGVAHGRLVPENVLIDRTGLGPGDRLRRRRRPPRPAVRAGAGRRHRAGRPSCTPPSPRAGPAPRRRWSSPPRTPTAACCGRGRSGPASRGCSTRCATPCSTRTPSGPGSHARGNFDLSTAGGIGDALHEFVGDPTGLADTEAAAIRRREAGQPLARPSWTSTLPVVPIITVAAPDPEPGPGARARARAASPSRRRERTADDAAPARRAHGTSSRPRPGSRSSTTTATCPGSPSAPRSRRPRRRST